MKAAAVAALVLALLAGCGAQEGPHAFRIGNYRSGDPGFPPIRLIWAGGHRPLRLHDYTNGNLFSPDRKTVVFADVTFGRLRFVDLVHRQLTWIPKVARARWDCTLSLYAWPRADRLLVGSWCGWAHGTTDSGLAVVDPVARKIVARPWDGIVHARRGRVLLLEPREKIGDARVALVEPKSFRFIRLRGVRIGMAHRRTVLRWVGFVVAAGHAYVLAEGDGVAEVDLRTGSVTMHRELRLLSRGKRFAGPVQQHSGTSNPARILSRIALWLGRGRIAVAGGDTWTQRGYDRSLPYGMHVLDTHTWTIEHVSAKRFCAGRRCIDAAGYLYRRAK